MHDRAVVIIVGLLAAGCTKSEPPEVTQPATSRFDAAPASGGSQVKRYTQQPTVTAVTLTAAATIRDLQVEMIAIAPDGTTWATAFGPVVRVFSGDQQRAQVQQQHNAAGGVGFSPDGAILRLGNHDLDVTTLAPSTQPEIPDLAAWVAAAGLPSPPRLSMPAARKSDDGSLVIVAGSGVTRDRASGRKAPESGDVDWLIALDATTRKPTDVLWHGKGAYNRFAISKRHVAAGGHGSLLVFDRKDLTKPIDLGATLRPVISVVWSADGELLAAIGASKKIAVWRTGTWSAPAAIWEVGGDYQRALALHPTRPLLAVGNLDGHLRIYGLGDTTLASPPLVLDHDLGGPAHAAAFTADGTKLFVAVGLPIGSVVQFDLALTP